MVPKYFLKWIWVRVTQPYTTILHTCVCRCISTTHVHGEYSEFVYPCVSSRVVGMLYISHSLFVTHH